MATVLCLSTGMTALAAPETMPDGGVFDAEYYAETYPDVKAAFGDNKKALYNHYLQFGKAEGRMACRPAVDSPVKNATLVSSSKSFDNRYTTEVYSNGIKVMKSRAWSKDYYKNEKYWIPRTDYSDGLLDKDGNGIDDRDSYNFCGYTDLNYNCIADGAPTYEGLVPECDVIGYEICKHGVIEGIYICNAQECLDRLERLKGGTFDY